MPREMVTLVLFDFDAASTPIGRASLELDFVPAVVLWNDCAFMLFEKRAIGHCYRKQLAVEIPYMELRKTPGLGPGHS
jgi:hypothetical protein